MPLLASRLLSGIIFAPLHALSLSLNAPVAGTGYSAILTNGSATVSWTSGSGDPSVIALEIQNNLTLDSFEFARGVDVSLGSITRMLDNVPGDDNYFMQAVENTNVTHVYAESPTFVVAGIAVTTTNPVPTPTTSSTTSSTSTTNQTEVPTAVPEGSGNSNRTPVGAIIGGVIGAVVLVFVALAAVYCVRRRPKAPTVYPLVHDDSYDSYPPVLKQDVRLEQVRSEKIAAQRHRDQLQSDLERSRTAAYEERRVESNGSQSEAERHLRQQLQVMSERVLELEEQQRELELFDGSSVPPPDYTPTAAPQ